jgi:hypothetical protein
MNDVTPGTRRVTREFFEGSYRSLSGEDVSLNVDADGPWSVEEWTGNQWLEVARSNSKSEAERLCLGDDTGPAGSPSESDG